MAPSGTLWQHPPTHAQPRTGRTPREWETRCRRNPARPPGRRELGDVRGRPYRQQWLGGSMRGRPGWQATSSPNHRAVSRPRWWTVPLPRPSTAVDLDLVEPAGMARGMDELQPGVPCLRQLDGSRPAVRGAVVDDPEDAPGLPVGGGGHDPLDQATEGRDSRLRLTASDNLGPVHVEGREVGPGPAPLVFVFDAHCATGAGRRGRVDTVTRLDARLLVRRNDELVVVPAAGKRRPEHQTAPDVLGRPARPTRGAVAPGR